MQLTKWPMLFSVQVRRWLWHNKFKQPSITPGWLGGGLGSCLRTKKKCDNYKHSVLELGCDVSWVKMSKLSKCANKNPSCCSPDKILWGTGCGPLAIVWRSLAYSDSQPSARVSDRCLSQHGYWITAAWGSARQWSCTRTIIWFLHWSIAAFGIVGQS